MTTTITSVPALASPTPVVPITVSIFSHVERLGPIYDTGWVHFSVNLSAALVDGTDQITPEDVAKFLKLWAWDWSSLAILGIDDKDKTVIFDPDSITLLLDQAPAPIDALKDALTLEIGRTIAIDPTLRAFRTNAPLEEKTIDEKTRNWKSFLAHVSTFPAPLPQSLKLCAFFRVKAQTIKDLKVKEIVATPSGFGAGGPFLNRAPQLPSLAQPWDVTDQTKPLHRVAGAASAPDYYSWQYDTTAAPLITALLNRCSTDSPTTSSASFMSLEKLWVTKGTTPVSQTPGAPALSEDWTTQSESKLADAFDFPRRLLDALQANIQNLRDNGALLWSVDPVFHEAFLSSLRDLANFGLAKPPEGRTLAEALVAQFDGPVQEIVDLLTSQQALLYPNAAAWISRLQGFLSAVEPGTRFPDVPATARLDLLTAYARALEHLYILFAAGSNLAPFFLAEWNTVLKAHPFWIAHQKDIAQRLNDLQLRKRMALGNCGIAWRSLKGDLHNHDELLKTVQDAFGVYFDKRFGGSPDTGYKDYLPSVASKLAPRIGQHTAAFASDFVDKVLLPIEPTPDDPASFNEDLIVQVDRLQRADTSGSSDDQTDLLRRLAGVGVLLRRKDTTDWRCLNLAQLEVTGQALGFDAAPIPVRLGYRNGLRQSYVAYRNQPMAARSPAADLSRMHEMTQGKNGNAPLLRYTNPYSVMGGPRLEALVYGITYDAAVFLLGNAGSLPSEATAKDGSGRTIPWKFKFPSAASPPPFTQQIPYVRRVPVGLVRLGVPKPDKPTDPKPRDPTRNEEMDRLDLPPIPDTVLPITRSLHVRQAEPQKDREDAVLLLTPQDGPWVPNRSQFNFVVRPPSITLDVWDRWTAVDSTSRPKRINVWARYHELTDVPDTVSKASKANIPIDDPAVTQIRFQFTQIYPASGTPQSVDCAVPATTGDCSNDLKCVQAEAIRVEVFSSNTLTIPTACANPLRIGIPPGQVWKLDILPVIKDTGRFHPKLASSVGRPVTLYIEVASPLLFAKPEDLRATLNAALQLNVKNEQLQISLVPPSANPLWDRIHRIETLLQRWRWDGRPVCYFDWDKKNVPHVHYGFPVAAALTGTLDQFDGTLFGSRQSSDYLSLPSGADFAAPPANSPKLLYQTDLSTLPGALYFRAGIRVFSRYEGLLLGGDLIDSIDSRPPSTGGNAERWRRLVVPCRYKKPIPRPLVKLVLPLTQTAAPSVLAPDDMNPLQAGDDADTPAPIVASNVPGVVVILDESWYSDTMGGFGEALEWEIVRAALPDVVGDSRLELSPDPILDVSEDPLAGRGVQAFPAIGAIGYTNDTGTLAPLFTRASFVIPPPAVDGIPDLSWYFLKLRFRRRLSFAPLLNTSASDWTQPVWAQLLPPSDLVRLEGQIAPMGINRMFFDPSLPGFRNRDAKDKNQVKPQPTTTGDKSQCAFDLWVLLTRRIVDALGRRNQESFVNLKRIEKLSELVPVPSESVVRLVEVQRRQNVSIGNLDDLVQAMFPNAVGNDIDPPDATARIVRISAPIEVDARTP